MFLFAHTQSYYRQSLVLTFWQLRIICFIVCCLILSEWVKPFNLEGHLGVTNIHGIGCWTFLLFWPQSYCWHTYAIMLYIVSMLWYTFLNSISVYVEVTLKKFSSLKWHSIHFKLPWILPITGLQIYLPE